MRVSVTRLLTIAAIIPAAFLFISCEDSGTVGSSFSGSNQIIQVDTLRIDAITPLDLPTFSGELINFSAGQYDDPLFGSFRATAIIMPGLSTAERVIGSGDELYLVLYPTTVYGDSTSTAAFDLIEIGERWRGTNWTLDDRPVLTGNVIGSFEVGPDADSIAVPIDRDWISNYSTFIPEVEGQDRDSTFRANIFGFAIVPAGGNKIVGFSASQTDDESFTNLVSSYLYHIPELSEGGWRISSRSWAYSLEHDFSTATVPMPENATPVLNTFKNAFQLDFRINEDILGTKNISRVEAVLYEDTLSLQNSLPEFHNRPESNRTFIYRLEPGEQNFLVLRNPNDNIFRNNADASYRFNLLGYTNDILFGTPQQLTFVATSGSNNGLIYPNLIYNTLEPVFFPKIIVTKLIPESL
ncbi:MAG: hypothetical protein LC662_07185 [Rhodothermaceae bacterium]|nr:hypothetical protein [Rhodothermaceae bacterium]